MALHMTLFLAAVVSAGQFAFIHPPTAGPVMNLDYVLGQDINVSWVTNWTYTTLIVFQGAGSDYSLQVLAGIGIASCES
jgi:hypothetical protein